MCESLSTSFSESLSENVATGLTELAEVALDSVMDEGILKEIPILSTVVSLYKIGNSIRERHYMRKLAIFFDAFNKGLGDPKVRDDLEKKLKDDSKIRNQEIEYLLILIDRYINHEKPRLLAKLYMLYLKNKLEWHYFTMYAEIIDRMFISDFMSLFEFLCHGGIKVEDNVVELASVLRLQSYGFVEQQVGMAWGDYHEPAKHKADFDYYITDFGRIFCNIFDAEIRQTHSIGQ